MSENRACKEFISIDKHYGKTNCASCTRWERSKCREMIWIPTWIEWCNHG